MEEVQNINFEDITLEKFSKICRLCFSNIEIKSFFKLHFEGLLLFEIFREITMLHAEEGDSLPKQICITCTEKIISTFLFIRNCQETDKILRHKIKNSTTKPNVIQDTVDKVKETGDRIPEFFNKLDNTIIEDNIQSTESTSSNVITINQRPDIGNYMLDSSQLKQEIKTKRIQSKPALKFSKIRRVIGQLPKLIGPPFTCDTCGESHDTLSAFKHHCKKSTKCLPRIYLCNFCNKRFVSKSKVQLHMRTHTKERPYECQICDERFRYAQNFVRHKKGHALEKPYACNICKKRFTRSASKVEHMRLHTGELPFLCTHCGMVFSNLKSLKLHTVSHTLDNEATIKQVKEFPKNFFCCKCPKKYATKRMLLIHERSHLEENTLTKKNQIKKFLCSICGKTYATKGKLMLHGTVHSKIKSHFCRICNKAFCYQSNLKNHMLIHSGERPHTCSVCNKAFIQKIHLRQHMQTHTGEKLNVCNICGKSFALKGNLMVHMRQHTGETPYYCSVCNRGFYDSSSMKKHLKRHKEV